MNRIILSLLAMLLLAVPAGAQSIPQVSEPGFRLQDGGNINKMAACSVTATYYFTGTPAATDQVFYVATMPMKVTNISAVFSVAAGGASTLQVTKDTGTQAPGAGTDLLTSTGFDLNLTANTTQHGTLVTSAASLTLARGDRLAVDFANAIQSSAGVVVTACLSTVF